MVLDLSKKNQFTDWTFVGYLTGEFDFSDRSPKFQQAFKAAEYYAMYDTQNDAWHFSQDPLGVVKNNVSLRYPHWTVPYSESPYSGKEHLTVSREGKKPIHIYVGTLPSNNVISTFNSQLDAYINQYPDVIDYYAGEGSGVDCYLAHIRGLASKPIKKASDELRVIKKTLVQNEDNLLRVDEFIELLEIIKTKIANASSSDDVKYQLQILNNLMQEARQLLKTSVSNANSQAKQIKQEKLTKQVSKPKFDLSPLITQITELSVALDMPFGTRGFEGGQQYYQDANNEYQTQARKTKARIIQLHSQGASKSACEEEIAKLAKTFKQYQKDIDDTVRGAKSQRARGKIQKQANDGCLTSFVILLLTGTLLIGGFSYTSYQVIASLF